MKKYNFTKKQIGYFVFLCTLFTTLNAHSQTHFKYSDDSISVDYEIKRSIIDVLRIKGKYLPTDSIQYDLGTVPKSKDLCFWGHKLGDNGIGGLLDDSYNWYGGVGCNDIENWKYFTITIKRAGKVVFRREMPATTLNFIEDSKFMRDRFLLTDNFFLTNISKIRLEISGYSINGKILFENATLEPQQNMKTCEKCFLLLSSSDGFVDKVKIF